ncbi:prolyl oligopeptidase family serine peptidase [Sinorhizobium fredii]|nr:S9 family peptidase [Sinorhizobium fredii]
MWDKSLRPPLPRAEPRIRVLHDDVTVDRYGWLRDRENPDVRAYLEAENSYAEQATAHLRRLKTELIAEIEGRQPCEGATPPFQVGPFDYFQGHERGLPHPVWWRRPVTGGSAELVLDPNAIPGADVFYWLGVFEPSDDGRYLAFSVDLIGAERYELRVRDMSDGRDVWRDAGSVGQVVWAADNHTLFFTRERPDRRQHHQIVRLNVGRGNSEVVFEEANERLAVLVRRSQSGAWLFLDVLTTSDMSSYVQRGAAEVWCLPADEPGGQWRRIVMRELGHQIYAEHWYDRFLFRVDDAGPYWRLVSAPIDDPSPSRWEEVVPHRAGVTIDEIHVLEQHLVLLEREGLRPRLISRNRSGRVGAVIVPDEPSCTIRVGLSAGGCYSAARHPFRSSKLTYSVSSFVTPDTFIEHDFANDRSVVLCEARVPGYDATQYLATVVMAEAEDGVQVPISLVARRDRTSPGPVLLSVYGCYGIPRLPSFLAWPSSMTARLSLLDREVAFGIVHVRGGGELGRPWHDAATRDQKRITHTDLISATEGLIERGFATRDGVVIEGKSGGGGTVLATAVFRPNLFRAVVAEVPLADIIDTQLDSTMPYTLKETAEYGDPQDAYEYRYLRSYDPYYNLSPERSLPPTYVDAALDDGQVIYYQPARYVAQRRSCATDRDPDLVFRIRMVGGHSGPSHGPGIAEQAAFRMAWVLDQLRSHAPPPSRKARSAARRSTDPVR